MTTNRNASKFKPEKFKHYLTLRELELEVGKDRSWLKKLEAEGRIPKAKRVKRGMLQVRLWSPGDVDEIKRILATLKPGRPSK
jgi:predicted DNA-binding transcriptional regulator AlpA